jgi:hypothetical protein
MFIFYIMGNPIPIKGDIIVSSEGEYQVVASTGDANTPRTGDI